jgi:cytochrome c peroxidase
MRLAKYNILILFILVIIGCGKDNPPTPQKGDLEDIEYNPTQKELNIPSHFTQMLIPEDNPTTEEGVELGRFLFYDPILSGDSTMSCAGCHFPEFGFADPEPTSTGIDGFKGTRNSMSLINVGFYKNGFFWDGRAATLEEQALLPVEDPIELHAIWPEVIEKLKIHESYPSKFRKAFGINDKSEITKELAAKAIAQFERTILSTNSKFDKITQGDQTLKYNDLELLGYSLFFDEDPDVPDAECGHCHNTPLGSSDNFFNNGIQTADNIMSFDDIGFGKITGNINDNGKMKAPSLRNIRYTAPYMHDGRFNTLDEVLTHYNEGGLSSPTKDPLIHKLGLNKIYLDAIKAFILTLEDTTYLNNPNLKSPF